MPDRSAIDRFRDTILIIRNVVGGDDPAAAYDEAVAAIERDMERLASAPKRRLAARPRFDSVAPATANCRREEYEAAVRRSIEFINAGDAFQIVPSIRFEVDFDGDAFAVYRALRLGGIGTRGKAYHSGPSVAA